MDTPLIEKLAAPTSNCLPEMTQVEWEAMNFVAKTSPGELKESFTQMTESAFKLEAELMELVRAGLSRMFHVWTLRLFNDYPKLQGFRWQQFTPPGYTVAVVNNYYPAVFLTDADPAGWSKGTWDPWAYPHSPESAEEMKKSEKYSAWKDVIKFLNNIPESALFQMFGHNVCITVTREYVDYQQIDPNDPNSLEAEDDEIEDEEDEEEDDE